MDVEPAPRSLGEEYVAAMTAPRAKDSTGKVAADSVRCPPETPGRASRPRLRTAWSAMVGVAGAAMGLAPHVLHHLGLLVGTALVAGALGTWLFAGLGLLASVPLLLRLRRRSGNWWAPGLALVVFAAMFSLSTFVIGPALTGQGGASVAPASPSLAPSASEHAAHHQQP